MCLQGFLASLSVLCSEGHLREKSVCQGLSSASLPTASWSEHSSGVGGGDRFEWVCECYTESISTLYHIPYSIPYWWYIFIDQAVYFCNSHAFTFCLSNIQTHMIGELLHFNKKISSELKLSVLIKGCVQFLFCTRRSNSYLQRQRDLRCLPYPTRCSQRTTHHISHHTWSVKQQCSSLFKWCAVHRAH